MSSDGPIHHKFNVTRTDGAHLPGRKHDGCFYFVLDVDHDPYALSALTAYATACITGDHPELGQQLKALIRTQEEQAEKAEDQLAAAEKVVEAARDVGTGLGSREDVTLRDALKAYDATKTNPKETETP